MATNHNGSRMEILPPPMDSSSTPPPLFDGTTRLYITYRSPYAQRAWITRNLKGLHSQMKLVPLSLRDKPCWYREKVYTEDKVPSLEYDGRVIGESLDIMKYIDRNFEGPPLLPTDPEKIEFGEELWSYSAKFNLAIYTELGAGRGGGETIEKIGPALDRLEAALHKFEDGPFFLGQLSLVDVAYIPILERIQLFLLDVWKHEITEARPKLAAWMAEMNKIEAYTQAKYDPKDIVDYMKQRFSIQP